MLLHALRVQRNVSELKHIPAHLLRGTLLLVLGGRIHFGIQLVSVRSGNNFNIRQSLFTFAKHAKNPDMMEENLKRVKQWMVGVVAATIVLIGILSAVVVISYFKKIEYSTSLAIPYW